MVIIDKWHATSKRDRCTSCDVITIGVYTNEGEVEGGHIDSLIKCEC